MVIVLAVSPLTCITSHDGTGLTRGFIHFDQHLLGRRHVLSNPGRIVNKYAPDSPRFDELFARNVPRR